VYCDKSSVEELSSLESDVAFAARLEPALEIVRVSPWDETAVTSSSLLCDDVEDFAVALAEILLLPKMLLAEL
jgi:hypothetical protein